MEKDVDFLDESRLNDYLNTQKNLMNEKRIRILLLLKNQSKSWSNFMNDLDMRNPKLLHDHITSLSSSKLIQKNSEGQYQLTKKGLGFLESNLEQMKKVSKLLEDEDNGSK